jgi:TRAP-type C4-dicarboxylate transport system permease small subunit
VSDQAQADHRALVIQRHRRLKWPALDPLEAGLMVLCGVAITGFSLSVLADVVTREIGAPWLWLQQLTTGCFAWGVFIGIAAATRRNEHLYLTEILYTIHGTPRIVIEVVTRSGVLAVAGFMIWFGYKSFLLDFGSYRMPSLIPLAYYTASIPLCGALVFLFTLEQLINGLRKGFEEPDEPVDLTGARHE